MPFGKNWHVHHPESIPEATPAFTVMMRRQKDSQRMLL